MSPLFAFAWACPLLGGSGSSAGESSVAGSSPPAGGSTALPVACETGAGAAVEGEEGAAAAVGGLATRGVTGAGEVGAGSSAGPTKPPV